MKYNHFIRFLKEAGEGNRKLLGLEKDPTQLRNDHASNGALLLP